MLELKRQGIHLLNGSAIAMCVYLLKPLLGIWILFPLFFALILMYAVPRLLPDLWISNRLMHHFERRKDIKSFPFRGAIMFGLGIIAPILLLEVNYACAVILTLSVGDAFSTIVGRKYGRHHVGRRSLEGSAAFIFTSVIAASLLITPSHAALLAFVGASIELLGPFDDNVTIPLGLSLLVLLI
jgi:dolichol kinase